VVSVNRILADLLVTQCKTSASTTTYLFGGIGMDNLVWIWGATAPGLGGSKVPPDFLKISIFIFIFFLNSEFDPPNFYFLFFLKDLHFLVLSSLISNPGSAPGLERHLLRKQYRKFLPISHRF
jgi:hypothetical protein